MPFTQTGFRGLTVFEPVVFGDSRGHFLESYNARLFSDNGIDTVFVQDNESYSSYGVIRGLHFQAPPFAQAKLIRVVGGRILDVVVDIRHGSPSFGQSFSIELSQENKKQLFIPPGFAHGFSVISENALVLYKCDQLYNRASEGGILFNDPALAIDWKIPADKAIVSEKDKTLPTLSDLPAHFHFVP